MTNVRPGSGYPTLLPVLGMGYLRRIKVGMAAAVPMFWLIFGTVLESPMQGMTPREVANQFPVLMGLVVVASMTVPLVAWMLHRRPGLARLPNVA